MNIAIVGAGFSGAVIAHRLAHETDCRITVFDERDHVAGNCHTSRDIETGVMEHRYGPHIFHTSDKRVWDFVNTLATFRPYVNRVKAVTPRGLFTLPLNLLTINQFFGRTMSPAEAKTFVAGLGDASIEHPKNFEEQALRLMGRDLYENFFRGYTVKQWGCEPTELPASILQRLPIRFNYDDNYYNSTWQGIPEEGYTAMVEKLLSHDAISLRLGTRFHRADAAHYDHVFHTGPLDAYYDHAFGRLGYRTVHFERIVADGDYQGNAVINHTSPDTPFTRVAEHKHFTPWENHDKTLVFREYSRATAANDTPYYPMRRESDQAMLESYLALARKEPRTTFLGRLATYRYLDMHLVIGEALALADEWISARAQGRRAPIFPASVAT